MSKWRTENHFVSWLRLCPDNKISGAKIIGKGRLPTNNRATNASQETLDKFAVPAEEQGELIALAA